MVAHTQRGLESPGGSETLQIQTVLVLLLSTCGQEPEVSSWAHVRNADSQASPALIESESAF